MNHGNSSEYISKPINLVRGNIVEGSWSVPLCSEPESTEKTGEISWNNLTRVSNPHLGFFNQKLKTKERINLLLLGNSRVSGVVFNNIMIHPFNFHFGHFESKPI